MVTAKSDPKKISIKSLFSNENALIDNFVNSNINIKYILII